MSPDWFKSYLSDRIYSVHVNDVSSEHTKVHHRVPQGSVLGPILFTLDMLPLGSIIQRHCISFDCYTIDTQLYLSIKPDKTEPLARLQACLTNIKDQMTSNFFLLNSDKTEVIVLGHLRPILSDNVLCLDGITLSSSMTARNLGVIFDKDLSLILNRFLGLLSFTYITLPRSEASCLKLMLKNMSLLLLDWTTATHYCHDIRMM